MNTKLSSPARIGKIFHKMMFETGVNPTLIYCQVTGAPIGSLSSHEWDLMVATIDWRMDDDELIDELYARTLNSMRPSPAWNYIQRGTYNKLRIADPVRLASYLLGRYYEPKDSAYDRLRRSQDQRMQDGINRIQMFQFMESWGDKTAVREFLTVLLLLDAEYDLAKLSPVKGFPRNPAELKPNLFPVYINHMHDEYLRLTADRQKEIKRRKLEESYFAKHGNPLSIQPAWQAFKEIKPKSPLAQAREKKAKESTAMELMIAALMDSASGESTKKPTKADAVMNSLAQSIQAVSQSQPATITTRKAGLRIGAGAIKLPEAK